MEKELHNILFEERNLLCEPIPSDYELSLQQGVYSFLSSSFKPHLQSYLQVFEQWRADTNADAITRDQLKNLPFTLNNSLWRARRKDFEIVERILSGKEALTILETGSWNGWLSNQLSRLGHKVVAIDYFGDDLDGLQARKHYPQAKWTSIQMDLEDIHHLQPIFDVVLFNRNLAHSPGIEPTLQKAKELLKPNGLVLATGLNIVYDSSAIDQHFKASEAYFSKQGISFYLKENIKKYLCPDDMPIIKNQGFQLHPYPQRLLGKVKSHFKANPSKAFWAIYES